MLPPWPPMERQGSLMAKEIITKLIDDTDGGVAHETVKFGLDGHLYEIDLSSKNAKNLRNQLDPFISHGHRDLSHTTSRMGRDKPAKRATAAKVVAVRAAARTAPTLCVPS